MTTGHSIAPNTVRPVYPDDILLRLGTDGDIVLVNRSTALTADTELANVIVGTSDHQGVAANSLLLSNITANGDIGLYVNNGGNSLEAVLVDASGKQIFLGFGVFDTIIPDGNGVVIGNSSQVAHGSLAGSSITGEFQVLGTAGADGGVVVGRWSANASAAKVIGIKSRGATVGTLGLVSSGDAVVEFGGVADDGADLTSDVAMIRIAIDGTASENDTPGRIEFWTTTDASATMTQAAQFGNDQNLYILDNNGQVIGHTAQLTVFSIVAASAIIPEFQVLGTGAADASMVVGRFAASNRPPMYGFIKSRSATVGGLGLVSDNDELGEIVWFADDGTDYQFYAAQFLVEVDATAAANDVAARFVWKQYNTKAGVDAFAETMRLNSLGTLIIGGQGVSEHGTQDIGLLMNQGGHDGLIFTLQSTDVAHGLGSAATQVVGTPDTADFFGMEKFAGATGGVKHTAYGENAAVTTNYRIQSFGGQADTTHTSAGRALIEMYASQHDGANALADIAADGNVWGVIARVGTADRTIAILDEDGELHLDAAVPAAFDAFEDVALVRALSTALSPDKVIRSEWDRFVGENEARLVELGILGAPRSEGGLLNVTRLQMLHNGALWQMWTDVMEIAKALPAETKALLPERILAKVA